MVVPQAEKVIAKIVEGARATCALCSRSSRKHPSVRAQGARARSRAGAPAELRGRGDTICKRTMQDWTRPEAFNLLVGVST